MNKESWFNFQQEQGIYLFSKASQLATEAIQPPLQWIPQAHDPGIRKLQHLPHTLIDCQG
jgi:hypothetical protein